MAALRIHLLAAKVPQEMINSLVMDGLESVTDFLNLFDADKSTAFKEIKNYVAAKFPIRVAQPYQAASEAHPERAAIQAFTEAEQNLLTSRVRTSWQEGMKSQEKEEKAEACPADIEAPMSKVDAERLQQNWWNKHSWEQVPFMQASTRFRTRVFNELRLLELMLHTVEQAIPQVTEPMVRDRQLLPVGPQIPGQSSLMMQTQPSRKRKVTCTLEYFAALRLLMGLYAYLGNYVVEYKTETGKVEKLTFWTWEKCLAYHDDVMMHTLAIRGLLGHNEDAILNWVRKRDEIIRMHMAYWVNKGMPGDMALTTAMTKFSFAWSSTDSEKLDHLAQDSLTTDGSADRVLDRYQGGPPHNPGYEQPRKRQRQNQSAGSGSSRGGYGGFPVVEKGGRWKINTTPKGLSLCDAFQGKAGCQKYNCNKEHVCAVIMGPGGVVCGNRSHGACSHRER